MRPKDIRDWSEQEIALLIQNYPKTPWRELTTLIKRTRPAIEQKGRQLGIRRNSTKRKPRDPNWSDKEISILKEQMHTRTRYELSRITGRPVKAIATRMRRLGLTKQSRKVVFPPHSWTPEEDKALSSMYACSALDEIAHKLQIRPTAIYARAHRLGLSRSNSGSTVPIGTERIYRKLRERKVAMTGVRSQDWKRVEVADWEALHGPVPLGYVLVNALRAERCASNLTLTPIDDVPVIATLRGMSPQERMLLSLKAQFTIQLKKIERKNAAQGHFMSKSPGTRWSKEEDDYLLQKRGSMTLKALGEKLGRSSKALQHRLKALSLNPSSRRPFS